MTSTLSRKAQKSSVFAGRKGRFLVIAPFFPRSDEDPLIGGAMNNPAHLWIRVAQEGYSVVVLTYGRSPGSWVYRGVKVLCLGRLPFKGAAKSLALEFKVWRAIRRYRLTRNLSQARVYDAGGLALAAMRFSGILKAPLTATARPAPKRAVNDELESSFWARLGRRVQYKIDAFLYRKADVLIAPSFVHAEQIMRYYGVSKKRIIVLPNGYDETFYCRSDLQAAAVRQRLGIAGREIMILMVARRMPQKGLEAFIEAARLSERQAGGFPLRFVCVADNPLFRRTETPVLRDKWPRNCMYIEDVRNKDLPGFYAAARICVFPTTEGEIPSALYEACACGCTVLACRLPGIEDVVDGPFMENVSPEAIAQGINDVLNRELRTNVLSDYPLGSLMDAHLHLGQSLDKALIMPQFSSRKRG